MFIDSSYRTGYFFCRRNRKFCIQVIFIVAAVVSCYCFIIVASNVVLDRTIISVVCSITPLKCIEPFMCLMIVNFLVQLPVNNIRLIGVFLCTVKSL